MKKINSIIEVKEIFETNKRFVFTMSRESELAEGCYILHNEIPKCILQIQLRYCSPFIDGFVYQLKNSSEIFYFDFIKNQQILPKGYNFYAFNQNIENFLKLSLKKDEVKHFFLLDVFLNKKLMLEFPDYCFQNIFLRAKRKTIDAFGTSNLWKNDISKYGKNRTLNSEQIIPNEIDGALMGFEDSLYVPLQGGQLLCLDINTGDKKWIQDYNGRSGFYSLNNDKIYKHDGLSLLEIDAKTGLALRSKIFSESDEAEVQSFYSLNGFWTYEDVIILYGLDNTVVMLNKNNFSLFGFISLSAPISTDKNNVIWDKNKLYVLDLNNTLHIFENEKLPD
ncbi:PQQ-like beta-propeller repeat protein [Bizionia argentinensis]|uniref:PQQ-like beta-propeller repeat protein n=1 Tax=Bizionia argentinensis TaxID=456455 RepID=UPI000222FF7B|nr:PQQ-like beta-propeller repeat protein [Bizionia argentinensis]